MRLSFNIPTDHFVLQYFDPVGWAMWPVKIPPPEMTLGTTLG